MLTSRVEMEAQLIREPRENILRSRQYFEGLTEIFNCQCGERHGMAGIPEDYLLVQGGKIRAVPVLVIVKDLGSMEWKSVLYRCPKRYTLLQWRPSHPAIWSAEIELVKHDAQNSTSLPDQVFKIFSSHADRVNVSML